MICLEWQKNRKQRVARVEQTQTLDQLTLAIWHLSVGCMAVNSILAKMNARTTMTATKPNNLNGSALVWICVIRYVVHSSTTIYSKLDTVINHNVHKSQVLPKIKTLRKLSQSNISIEWHFTHSLTHTFAHAPHCVCFNVGFSSQNRTNNNTNRLTVYNT